MLHIEHVDAELYSIVVELVGVVGSAVRKRQERSGVVVVGTFVCLFCG